MEMELAIQMVLALAKQAILATIVPLKHVVLCVVKINLVILLMELVHVTRVIHLILKLVIVLNLVLTLVKMVEYVMTMEYVHVQINGKEMIVLKPHVQQHYVEQELLLYVVQMVKLV
jgi:hypothetical protein